MTFSCSDALSEVATEYQDMPLETRAGKTVKLRNLLSLPGEGLKSAMVLLKAFSGATEGGDFADALPKMWDLLLLVADDTAALKKEMADWPLGMYMRVIEAWQEATSLGEAPDSES